MQRARGDAIDPRVEMDPHIAFRQHTGERGTHAGGLSGQHLRPTGEELEAQSVGIATGFAQPAAQSVAHREHHLDAAGPGSHHPDAHRSLGGEHSLDERVPAGDEVADGLDRHHRAPGAGHVAGERGRADVDGEHVVGHRRAIAADDLPVDRIESDDLVAIEACVREARQGTQIDVDLVVGVVSGDVPGEHPGVRRLHVTADERDPNPRHRPHSETLEHDDVAVPAAGEYQVLDDRRGAGVHGVLHDAPASDGIERGTPLPWLARRRRVPDMSTDEGITRDRTRATGAAPSARQSSPAACAAGGAACSKRVPADASSVKWPDACPSRIPEFAAR